MIILPPDLARTWEEKSIQAGARIKDLMRQAIAGALPQLTPFLPSPSVALILVGSGHNGDDAVLLGLELKDLGWSVEYLLSRPVGRRLHPDSRIKPKLWKKAIVWPAKPSRFLQTQGPRLVIDGLLGLGSIPPPRPAEGAILTWVAQEKRATDLYVAIDLPSGLHPATGAVPGPAFPADLTLALGSVKTGCLRDSALPVVGQLRGVPIDFGTPSPKLSADLFLPQEAWKIIRSRSASLHKHSAGTVHLWAGSAQYPGAANLASSGALRSGAGFVRLFTDRTVATPLSPNLPELLLAPIKPGSFPNPEIFLHRASAALVGPGLPPSPALKNFLTQLLPIAKIPLVLDAGALEIIAAHPALLATATCPLLLTPHAGELAQLLGHPITDRAEAAQEWLKKFPSTLLIAKGAHTLIATSSHPFSFNGSGGPAQATAGMGDLLAGLLTGLLASGYPPYDAARLAVSWHGLASDQVARSGGPAVLASDVAHHLSTSWRTLIHRAK